MHRPFPVCQSYPPSSHPSILTAYRNGGVTALADFPSSSFCIQESNSWILGRGVYSGTGLYFFTPNKGLTRVSTQLRELGRWVDYQPDPAGVRDYLCYGFVPAPRTIFTGIQSVPPGTVCRLNNNNPQPCWFSLATPITNHSPTKQLWPQLQNHVAQARADTVLLSGGLDSAMVAAAAQEQGHKLLACHARFNAIPLEQDEDTLAARAIATHLDLPYREISFHAGHGLRYFQHVIKALDQPLGDPVTLPFYRLFQSLRGQRVLTGEGGDQLFGSWSMKPMLIREAYTEHNYCRNRAYLESFHKFSNQWQELLSPSLADKLENSPEQAIKDTFDQAPVTNFQDQIRWVDIRLKGLQHILPRIGAMATSGDVTLHHPLFEADMLNLSFALPQSLKQHQGREKVLLKQLAQERLPSDLIERRKIGMGVPTSTWFRYGLRPLAWYWLSPRRLRRSGLLHPDAVRALLKRDLCPKDGRGRRWGDYLWMLCVLEAWFASLRGTSS